MYRSENWSYKSCVREFVQSGETLSSSSPAWGAGFLLSCNFSPCSLELSSPAGLVGLWGVIASETALSVGSAGLLLSEAMHHERIVHQRWDGEC
jgi:hypothetical protein